MAPAFKMSTRDEKGFDGLIAVQFGGLQGGARESFVISGHDEYDLRNLWK